MKKIIITLLMIMAVASAAWRPEKIQGLYISWWTMQYPARLNALIAESKKHQINTFVCDFRSERPVVVESLKKIKAAGYYAVARVVVFEEGIGANYSMAEDKTHIQEVGALAKRAQDLGFDEVQFDYIRFADRGSADPRKKQIIGDLLKELNDAVSVPVQIDVFGSVAYQPHPIIGQDLRVMKQHVDAVCPMLYPSHFDNDRKRMGDPYTTMFEGTLQCKAKVADKKVRTIPYVQGFAMRMSYAQLSLKDYIKAQLQAVTDAGADGFIVWHAANTYETTFAAIDEHGPLFATPPLGKDEVFARLAKFGYTPQNAVIENGGVRVLISTGNAAVKPLH